MNWVILNFEQIWQLALDHLALSIPPIVVGLLISLPLGWVAHRYRFSRGVMLAISGLLYTIPSLPLFIMLPVLLGTKILDPFNVIVALTMYAVALLVRSVAEAFDSVPDEVRQSSIAMGFSPAQRVLQVELPLAVPVIVAGLRVVSASTVSLATVGSVIGVSSMGYFFMNGFQRNFPTEVLVGIVGTILIAAILDTVIVIAGRMLVPWTRVAVA